MKLPSFNDCLKIVEENEAFTHRIRNVDGNDISIFDYLMATYTDFSEKNAFELRGLCFTHNPDGSIHKRYILLHKFFNLNQCLTYQYNDVKNKKITRIMDKMDGSIIRFIALPNGKIVSKSKTFFGNDQTIMADQIFNNNPQLQEFIKESLDNNLCAIFELTSPLNRIVLPYATSELTLLQLRSEETGEYLDIYDNSLVKKYNIPLVKNESYLTLDQLIELKSSETNKEGWIIVFEDGQMVKVKTDWYCKLHGILTDKLTKENSIMEMILDNTIDDALAELDQTDARKSIIESLCHQVNHYILKEVSDCKSLLSEYQGEMKSFAIKNSKHKNFSLVSKIIRNDKNRNDDYMINFIKNELKQDNYRLEQSRDWLKKHLNFALNIQSFDEN